MKLGEMVEKVEWDSVFAYDGIKVLDSDGYRISHYWRPRKNWKLVDYNVRWIITAQAFASLRFALLCFDIGVLIW